MEDLSLHLLDIVENCTTAGASLVEIRITEDAANDRLEIRIKDNGRGMDAALAATATNPFVTTRTTRRVGLGLPLLKMAAEEAGGALTIESTPGVGTEVTASFQDSHIDRKPLGDIAGTLVALILGHPEIDFSYTHVRGGETIELDTRELKEQLGTVPIGTPAVLNMIRTHLAGAGEDRQGDNHG
ncbi:MAG: ATP-binding protein [Candidatus Krumholzibacteria bacterium]|nr:ATP-binding protein [Candidatus Krumholzibacteria bacterium]